MEYNENISTQQFSDNDRFSLMIRHSNRYEIPVGKDGSEILLTEEGKVNAYCLGNKLSPYKINKIITTPVRRCIQTAEHIAKGYGKNIKIESSNSLGGLHVYDWQLATDFLNHYGYEEWYNRVINDVTIPGMHNTEKYKRMMTDFLAKNTQDNGITIFISHDFHIALYHYALNKTKYTMFTDWVEFLSGLFLKNGEYVARFQNNQ